MTEPAVVPPESEPKEVLCETPKLLIPKLKKNFFGEKISKCSSENDVSIFKKDKGRCLFKHKKKADFKGHFPSFSFKRNLSGLSCSDEQIEKDFDDLKAKSTLIKNRLEIKAILSGSTACDSNSGSGLFYDDFDDKKFTPEIERAKNGFFKNFDKNNM